MQAINFYIVVDKIKSEPTKLGGFEIPDNQNNEIRHVRGKVISVGNNVQGVKQDDIVLYDKHAGQAMEYQNKLYYVIKQNDVVIVE